jgi:hypothetical protein
MKRLSNYLRGKLEISDWNVYLSCTNVVADTSQGSKLELQEIHRIVLSTSIVTALSIHLRRSISKWSVK